MSRKTTGGQITVIQTQSVLISTTVGVGVLSFPHFLALDADSGSPLLTLAGIILAVLFLIPAILAGRKFPKDHLVAYSKKMIGGPLTVLFCSLIILHFMLFTAGVLRQSAEAINLIVLPRTPTEITSLLVMLLCMVGSRRDIVKFAYIHTFYLPFILIPGVLIIVGALKYGEYLNLLPVTGIHPVHLYRGAFSVASLFQVSFVAAILIPHMAEPQKALKASIVSLLCSGFFYLFIIITATAVFGAEELKQMVYPTLELARSSSLAFGGIQRLDGLFIIVWVLTGFTTLYSAYYICLYLLSRLTKVQDYRLYSSVISPFILSFSLIPQDFFQVYSIVDKAGIAGMAFIFFYSLLLMIMSFARKGDSRHDTTG
ncbi:hypothetical protein AWM70_01590 [Paenibacillus yonginensis]|uniref:Uncharacterized protein n=1 Tax=Paenibacillus yonginensis TaxID=1462996 RepID=A0A1B1MW87_9BACL|nr:endospore germination permease [Paenibacillus yonginensis]ANS73434.1 hypothetical protein AWM70_01590 [Paenibacillus yonginensis]